MELNKRILNDLEALRADCRLFISKYWDGEHDDNDGINSAAYAVINNLENLVITILTENKK